MHNIDPYVLVTARDRARLTSLIREHLVTSWAMWINHTRGVGVDKDQVRDTISTTKADDQKDNEADELPPEAFDPHEHDEEQDLYEDMDDFAPMDLDGNCLPPVAPTAMGTKNSQCAARQIQV